MNATAEKSGQPKLTVNDFVLKAAVVAAVKVPKVNGAFDGDAIVYYGSINLAVAVAIDDGLVTPVIRDAQKKSLREINELVKDLATRARSKKLKPEEYQGGTMTVSNLGAYGIRQFFGDHQSATGDHFIHRRGREKNRWSMRKAQLSRGQTVEYRPELRPSRRGRRHRCGIPRGVAEAD